MHPERAAVWCALSSVGIFGPVFINGTVTCDVYLCLLSDKSVPFLVGYGIPMNPAWFQEDGARPQISDAVFHFLHGVFGILCYLRKDFHGHQPHRI
jgi:hypothetical protein